MEISETLYVSSRREWRAWLERYHVEKSEIWLICPGKTSGRQRVPYEESVEEALCFGWVDGLEKKFDAQSSAQRFTPRRTKSNWSELNKARARRLIEAGQMTEAGYAALGGVLELPFEVPPDILRAIEADPEIRANFERFPDDYRRVRIGFIEEIRKRPEVFEKRLAYFLYMTARNKKFGTWK